MFTGLVLTCVMDGVLYSCLYLVINTDIAMEFCCCVHLHLYIVARKTYQLFGVVVIVDIQRRTQSLYPAKAAVGLCTQYRALRFLIQTCCLVFYYNLINIFLKIKSNKLSLYRLYNYKIKLISKNNLSYLSLYYYYIYTLY